MMEPFIARSKPWLDLKAALYAALFASLYRLAALLCWRSLSRAVPLLPRHLLRIQQRLAIPLGRT
jgi:hypothetical protein